MANSSRVKKRSPINELRGEFEGFKKDMVVLEGKLSNIETEKENLRLVNQILIQKIKAVKNSDLPFKKFFLERRYEREKELTNLMWQRLVSKRGFVESVQHHICKIVEKVTLQKGQQKNFNPIVATKNRITLQGQSKVSLDAKTIAKDEPCLSNNSEVQSELKRKPWWTILLCY
eukprot:gene2536-731_t